MENRLITPNHPKQRREHQNGEAQLGLMVKTHWLPVRTSLKVTEGCKNQSKTYGSFKDTCATRSYIVAE